MHVSSSVAPCFTSATQEGKPKIKVPWNKSNLHSFLDTDNNLLPWWSANLTSILEGIYWEELDARMNSLTPQLKYRYHLVTLNSIVFSNKAAFKPVLGSLKQLLSESVEVEDGPYKHQSS